MTKLLEPVYKFISLAQEAKGVVNETGQEAIEDFMIAFVRENLFSALSQIRLGEVYIRQYAKPEDKQRAEEIIAQMKALTEPIEEIYRGTLGDIVRALLDKTQYLDSNPGIAEIGVDVSDVARDLDSNAQEARSQLEKLFSRFESYKALHGDDVSGLLTELESNVRELLEAAE